MYNVDMEECQHIVEFSFNSKQPCLMVRFLDGSLYHVKISNLPKKFQSHKPEWSGVTVSDDFSELIVKTTKELKYIPFKTIQKRGELVL